MKYSDLTLPAGWTIGKPYQATQHRTGQKFRKVAVRDFIGPDGVTRTLPAAMDAEALAMVQTVLANYDELTACHFQAPERPPRTDAEIVKQTNDLAREILRLLGYETSQLWEAKSSGHPRAKQAWTIARLAQMHLTATDPDDALEAIAAEIERRPNTETAVCRTPATAIVLLFKPNFESLVATGRKRQTIRPRRKRPIARLAIASLRVWEGIPYRSKQRVISRALVTRTRDITLTPDGATINGVKIAGLHRFAQADGFVDWSDLVGWFKANHPTFAAGEPFEGTLIEWEPDLG